MAAVTPRPTNAWWHACKATRGTSMALQPRKGREESPESLVSAARLNTGWRVIWYNKYGCPFLRSEDLGELSQECDVLMCMVEEHVMASSSELWSSGQRKWSISHEGEDGPKGLSTEGALPDCFASIRGELEEAQRARSRGGLNEYQNNGADAVKPMRLSLASSRRAAHCCR